MNLPVVHVFEKELASQQRSLQSVLPEHIDVKQFCRLAVMAVQRAPTLLEADRSTLFAALQQCAVDGLIPDGREAALVEFNRKDKKSNRYTKTVQYMPMVAGILKRVRQSGRIKSITARCVYRHDEFGYWIDEHGEHLQHRPAFDKENRGQLYLVYAMAKMDNDEVVVEPMSLEEVEKVRKSSKSPDRGPWKDWFERMAEKTVLHRIGRRLPNSAEIAEMMDREKWLYEQGKVSGVLTDGLQDKVDKEVQEGQDRVLELSAPTEDQSLLMNEVMGKVMHAQGVDDLRALGQEIEALHPDFAEQAAQAVDERRQALESLAVDRKLEEAGSQDLLAAN